LIYYQAKREKEEEKEKRECFQNILSSLLFKIFICFGFIVTSIRKMTRTFSFSKSSTAGQKTGRKKARKKV